MCKMTLAWSNAKFGAKRYGGKAQDYFAMALRLAHRGVDLAAQAKRKAAAEIAVSAFVVLTTVLFAAGLVGAAAVMAYVLGGPVGGLVVGGSCLTVASLLCADTWEQHFGGLL